MARTVFFSFHYQKDWSRMWNVRNSDQFTRVAGDRNNVRLFATRDTWEDVKRQGEQAIKNFINGGLRNSGVTVVLIGAETSQRKYVKYEIERSDAENKGMLGIYIHGLRDMDRNLGLKGENPFSKVSLSKTYPTYNWVTDNGAANFGSWVEQAAQAAGR